MKCVLEIFEWFDYVSTRETWFRVMSHRVEVCAIDVRKIILCLLIRFFDTAKINSTVPPNIFLLCTDNRFLLFHCTT